MNGPRHPDPWGLHRPRTGAGAVQARRIRRTAPPPRPPLLELRLPDPGEPAWKLDPPRRPTRLRPSRRTVRKLVVAAVSAVAALLLSGAWQHTIDTVVAAQLARRQATVAYEASLLSAPDPVDQAALAAAADDVIGAHRDGDRVWVQTTFTDRCWLLDLDETADAGVTVSAVGTVSDGVCVEPSDRTGG